MVARVCIELDVSQPRHHRIWIGEEKEGYWQEVVFENPPSYCGFCQMSGHEEKACYVKNPSLRNDPKKAVLQEQSRVPKSSGISFNGKKNGKNAETWRMKNMQPQLADKDKEKEDGWTLVQNKKNKPSGHITQALKTEVEKAKVAKSGNQPFQPRKEVADAEVPTTASFGIPSAEPFTMAISLTPFLDLEKLKKQQKPLNVERNEIHPSDQIQSQIPPLDQSGVQRKKDNSGNVLVLPGKDNQPLDLCSTKGSELHGEKKTEGTVPPSTSCSNVGNSQILEIVENDPPVDLKASHGGYLVKAGVKLQEDNERGLLAYAGFNSDDAAEINKIQPLMNHVLQIRPLDHQLILPSARDIKDTVKLTVHPLDTLKTSSVAIVSATEETANVMTAIPRHRSGGQDLGPQDLIQDKGQDCFLIGSQSQRDNTMKAKGPQTVALKKNLIW